MTERHFIVYHRDAAWHFTFRGAITGPMKTREEAVTQAIEDAIASGEPDVKVVVLDSETSQSTVWPQDEDTEDEEPRSWPGTHSWRRSWRPFNRSRLHDRREATCPADDLPREGRASTRGDGHVASRQPEG